MEHYHPMHYVDLYLSIAPLPRGGHYKQMSNWKIALAARGTALDEDWQ